ncbi:hypothetical protein PanWU01x14_229140 [Parasponia andersonii]|uniref:Uncharacterized protein n=1 Tax=Parasponia andersonii TaxID=3476 RepID=A0A2P5BLD5_PARAD|nr:hypothetical protein PanWU01x14_229140 [Parasponia andersonii]
MRTKRFFFFYDFKILIELIVCLFSFSCCSVNSNGFFVKKRKKKKPPMATEAPNQVPAESLQFVSVSESQSQGGPSSSSYLVDHIRILEERYQLVRSVGEECIQEDELRNL